MYQEAGRAIIGWSGGKARLEFKNALERGVTGSFRTKYSNQLVKAVNQLLPEYPNVRWYNSKESLYKAVSSYFGMDFVEPLFIIGYVLFCQFCFICFSATPSHRP